MKKIIALVLAMMMVMTMSAALADYSPEKPITIEFWHNRSSGANYDALVASVNEFNETIGAEKGIIVKEVFIGGYPDIFTKAQLSTQNGEQPAITVIGNTYVTSMMDDELLADMAPYAEKTGFDQNNLMDAFNQIAGNTDGHLYSMPYIRSTPLFYYNKTWTDEAGIVVPEILTIEDMEKICAQMCHVGEDGETVYGLELGNDAGYLNAGWLWQLGEPLLSEEGDLENRTSPAVDGTAMLKIMSDWDRWVKEGWCRPFNSGLAGSSSERMYQGKLFAVIQSSGSIKNCIKYMTEAGFELGLAQYPTYDLNNPRVECGGGQLVMLKNDNEDIMSAGWELMQFLMSDKQVYLNSISTGYLPTTKSVANYSEMLKFWEENPLYKVPFDQLLDHGVCQEYPAFTCLQEYITNWGEQISLMIQEGSITPEQAVEQLKINSAHLF